jgi:hypothetical protein
MRIASTVLAGAVAVLLTTPVLARNSDAKSEEKSLSSTCSAYQQAPDGSWTQLPCKETGERNNQPQTQHRTPAQGTDQEER